MPQRGGSICTAAQLMFGQQAHTEGASGLLQAGCLVERRLANKQRGRAAQAAACPTLHPRPHLLPGSPAAPPAPPLSSLAPSPGRKDTEQQHGKLARTDNGQERAQELRGEGQPGA